ncbi:MAG TPA: caspase family protein [Mucilaginibacter sp.]
MKKLNLYVLQLLFIALYSCAKADDLPKTYALVVGISDFANKSLPQLKYAQADAYAYYQFLMSPMGGRVPASNISYLSNEHATRQTVLGQLRAITDKAGPEDIVIVYIATHGVPDPKINSDLYYVMYDTDSENLFGTGLKKDDIIDQEQHTVAKIKLFFSDACHSGGSGIYTGMRDLSSDIVNKLQSSQGAVREPSFSILAATTSAELSQENAKWGGGHGVFTYFLIKGLSGDADKRSKYSRGNGDGIVTLRELYDYLNNAIPTETGGKQHPAILSGNPDIIPLSAISIAKYVSAMANMPDTELPVNNGPLQFSAPSAETPGFGPEETYVALKESEAYQALNSNFDQCYGKCVFLNHMGEGLVMYRGICTSNNMGEAKAVLNIANNRKGNTDDLLIGNRQNRGPSNPSDATFKFYFITSDPTKPKRYGQISLHMQAGQQTQIALDKENLILTPGGARDNSYLRYAGLDN